ncbi:MAG: HTH domain-containing protein [Anaerolineales bacterium]
MEDQLPSRPQLSFIAAAQKILRDTGKSYHVTELWKLIEEEGLAVSPKGKTPWKTLQSKISVHIMKYGSLSPFQSLGSGTYGLKEAPTSELSIDYSGKPPVLAFPNSLISKARLGITTSKVGEYVDRILNQVPAASPLDFHVRGEVEKDSNFRQIVSNVIITHNDHILRYTVGGGGSALGYYYYDSYSIGFGGHVEELDRPLWEWKSTDWGYWNSVRREILEETGFDVKDVKVSAPIVGVIVDERIDLGRKHFPFIHVLELPSKEIKPRKRGIRAKEWIPFSSLSNDFPKYVPWSKLCIQFFYSKYQKRQCHIIPARIKGKPFSFQTKSDIVLVVGQIGSGKTLACQVLEKEFGYRLIRGSEVLKPLLGYSPGEAVPRRRLQDEGYRFINGPDGHEKLALSIFEYLSQNPSKRCVIDGLRYPETLEALMPKLDVPVTVVYIESPITTLLEYHNSREGEQLSLQEFEEIVFHPVERHVGRFFELADIVIYNHGNQDSYINELMDYLTKELG